MTALSCRLREDRRTALAARAPMPLRVIPSWVCAGASRKGNPGKAAGLPASSGKPVPKKKSLLEEHIQHSVWMANHYNRVLISKARECLAIQKDGKVMRKKKKGPKAPKYRYNIDRGKD